MSLTVFILLGSHHHHHPTFGAPSSCKTETLSTFTLNCPSPPPAPGIHPSTFCLREFDASCCYLLAQSCPALCNPMDCSTPGFPVLHYLPEFAQTFIHGVGDIQPSHPLSPPSPPTLNLSHHQGLFQWVSSVKIHNNSNRMYTRFPRNQMSFWSQSQTLASS